MCLDVDIGRFIYKFVKVPRHWIGERRLAWAVHKHGGLFLNMAGLFRNMWLDVNIDRFILSLLMF